jgi:hypothetical protein
MSVPSCPFRHGQVSMPSSGARSGVQHGTSGVRCGAQRAQNGVRCSAQVQLPVQVQVQLLAQVPGRNSNSTGSAKALIDRTSGDVRYPVANRGRPDMARTARFGRD